MMQVADESVKVGYSCAALHPDGLILCTGMEDATVRIWETRTQKVGFLSTQGFSSRLVSFQGPLRVGALFYEFGTLLNSGLPSPQKGMPGSWLPRI